MFLILKNCIVLFQRTQFCFNMGHWWPNGSRLFYWIHISFYIFSCAVIKTVLFTFCPTKQQQQQQQQNKQKQKGNGKDKDFDFMNVLLASEYEIVIKAWKILCPFLKNDDF